MACPDPHSLRGLHRLWMCGNLKRAPRVEINRLFFFTGNLGGVFVYLCSAVRVVACKKSPLQLFGDEVSRTEYFRGITWANCAPAGFGGAVGAIRRQRAYWLRRVDKGGTRGHAAQPVALEGPAGWVCPVG